MALQRYCFACNTSEHWPADCPKKQPSKVAAQPKVAEQPVAAPTIVAEQIPVASPKSVAEPVAEQSSKYGRQDRWKARNKDKVRAYHRQYMRERRAANRPENFIIAKAE